MIKAWIFYKELPYWYFLTQVNEVNHNCSLVDGQIEELHNMYFYRPCHYG